MPAVIRTSLCLFSPKYISGESVGDTGGSQRLHSQCTGFVLQVVLHPPPIVEDYTRIFLLSWKHLVSPLWSVTNRSLL